MSLDITNLSGVERTVYLLKRLYERYGYKQYKMSKFEEYELYVRNKSFLVSDHIITFTDTDGKLMALKPDVTLSIIKNTRSFDNGVRKVYYNENVYRVPRGAISFKEIMQAGLECIGDVDAYCTAEVLMLAAKSLEEISPDYVLDVSHIGIVQTIVDSMGNLSKKARTELFNCIGAKNLHGIDSVCVAENVDPANAERLKRLVSMSGDGKEMLEILEGTDAYDDAVGLFETVSAVGGKVRIDFSVIDDTSYYSGIVFKGFIKGIPTSVLSGGRYDNLMTRMGKPAGAIGFAVYLDLLEELSYAEDEYDVDVLITYAKGESPARVCERVREIAESGKTVLAMGSIPEGIRYRELLEL